MSWALLLPWSGRNWVVQAAWSVTGPATVVAPLASLLSCKPSNHADQRAPSAPYTWTWWCTGGPVPSLPP